MMTNSAPPGACPPSLFDLPPEAEVVPESSPTVRAPEETVPNLGPGGHTSGAPGPDSVPDVPSPEADGPTSSARATLFGPTEHDGITLGEEKDRLGELLETGATCQACGGHAQMYRRPLSAGMALALLSFFRASENLPLRNADGTPHEGWLHAEDTFKEDASLSSSARGDFAKLRHWGLIERATDIRADGSPRSGLYRMTERGRQFCMRQLHVAPAYYDYKGKVCPAPDGVDRTPINIVDALGAGFHYGDLMEGVVVREARPSVSQTAAAEVAA